MVWAGLVGLTAETRAQSVWQGDVSTDWFDANNWVLNALPGAGSLTTLDSVSPNGAVVGDRALNGTAATGLLRVGTANTGSLSILDGGRLDSTAARIGDTVGGTGTVIVGGVNAAGDRSTWNSLGAIDVGDNGTGTLIIENGGRVDSVLPSVIGRAGAGTVVVRGSNGIHRSEWLSAGGITIGEAGQGTVTLADHGVMRIGLGSGTITLARDAGSAGTLNIGAAAGDAAATPGRLSAGELAFGAGTGLLTFNHTDRLFRFDPVISGNGTIGAHSGHTTLTADSSAFGGTTNVFGGELSVTGALGGSVSVMTGGTLGGTGRIAGPVTLNTGSTIAPGRSIGTLTVDNVTFQPGSTYLVEINWSGESDRIRATGTATINGGSVRFEGDFAGGVPYRILTADAGLNGTFDGVANSLPIFLDPILTYGQNSVDLTIARSGVAFRSVAGTANRIAVADALESLAFGHAVYDAVTRLEAADAASAFSALSGEVHASARSAIVEGNQDLAAAVNRRIRQAFSAAPVSGAAATAAGRSPLSYAATGSNLRADGTTRAAGVAAGSDYGFWGTGYGSLFRTGSTSNTSSSHSQNYGFLVGFDAAVTDDWRIGVVAGTGRTNFDVDALSSSGSSDNYSLGAYTGYRLGSAGVTVGALYDWHEIDTKRTVDFLGLSEILRAGYDARSIQLFGEAGYRFETEKVAIEPFAGLSYVNLDTRAFTESGGAAALSAGADTTDLLFSTIGARFDMETSLIGGTPVAINGMLGWRHAFGDVDPAATFTLSGSSPFTVEGAPIARNAVAVELGASSEVTDGVSMSAAYRGQFAEASSVHSLHAGLVIRTDLKPSAEVAPKPAGDWRFVAGLPMFFPWTKGSVRTGPAQADIYLSGWSALEHLRMIGVGELGAVFRDRFSGSLEAFYVNIDGHAHTRRGTQISLGFAEAITEARLGYRPVVRDWGWLEAYAGTRFWSLDSTVSVTTPGILLPATTVSGSVGERWFDPIVGLRGEYDIGNRFYLTAMGDIGGFGLGSDLSWRVQAGGGYRFTDNLAIDLQYKVLAVDYDNEKPGAARFAVDWIQQGPQVRAIVTF